MSIPAWEEEAGRPFLVHGESILPILMETVSAADQENRRKNGSRPGTAPQRATTPVNAVNHYVPGSGSYGLGLGRGAVTPAVRPGSAMGSANSKRQRLGDTASQGRTVLGAHRGNTTGNGQRVVSPSKIAGRVKTPGSSLPRPVSIQMPIPKPGTQHHAFGARAWSRLERRLPRGDMLWGKRGGRGGRVLNRGRAWMTRVGSLGMGRGGRGLRGGGLKRRRREEV